MAFNVTQPEYDDWSDKEKIAFLFRRLYEGTGVRLICVPGAMDYPTIIDNLRRLVDCMVVMPTLGDPFPVSANVPGESIEPGVINTGPRKFRFDAELASGRKDSMEKALPDDESGAG